MVAQKEIYRCPVCGNIVEVEFAGGGDLVCCGQKMEKLDPKTADFATEKHVPYIEPKNGGVLVKVGKETAHPMEPDHYIVSIRVCTVDCQQLRKFLKPGDKPEAFFDIPPEKVKHASEICNKHGLWKSQ